MLKRMLDITVSSVGLLLSAPVLLPVLFLVWRQDYSSPFYIARRVGKHGVSFRMLKIRSMVLGADKKGGESTAADDRRITPIGHFIRRWKLDEIAQLWNVLLGDMSLVGPRPNVEKGGVALFTELERRILEVKPGITDFASIVFADEGEILQGQANPDLAYNHLIRPWKSRLALFYVDRKSVVVDLRLLYLTALAIVSRPRALAGVSCLLSQLSAEPDLVEIALRRRQLVPCAPPGASQLESLERVANG
jgi:lipopolysaccharide/colanic/teichoic acid biosynthesis glycosyltransferase